VSLEEKGGESFEKKGRMNGRNRVYREERALKG